MKNFKELINELEEKKTMSLAQRRKAAQRMKKMVKTSSFKTKVAKKARKSASPEDLMKRAQKKAKLKLISKMVIICILYYHSILLNKNAKKKYCS